MKRPEINGWEVTTNENGIKMATLPRDTMEEILKYVEYADKQLRIGAVGGWLLFREFMPELNQKIEIYWSTDEVTKQIWRNDIPWTGNELPRFWRACH